MFTSSPFSYFFFNKKKKLDLLVQNTFFFLINTLVVMTTFSFPKGQEKEKKESITFKTQGNLAYVGSPPLKKDHLLVGWLGNCGVVFNSKMLDVHHLSHIPIISFSHTSEFHWNGSHLYVKGVWLK